MTKDKSYSVKTDLDDLEAPTTVSAPQWIDKAVISVRDDGVAILFFECAMPDQGCRIEVCRIAMTHSLAKAISKIITEQFQEPAP